MGLKIELFGKIGIITHYYSVKDAFHVLKSLLSEIMVRLSNFQVVVDESMSRDLETYAFQIVAPDKDDFVDEKDLAKVVFLTSFEKKINVQFR